ncbi:MAG: NADH-quinone oxidoreductase subunit J [Bifidobacteriaceae bacterium]|jgi:NADH-quinone oxidoreductase subunit J|nr:NADH-quinone oxidoreductase subunit J [Bifidobacteriaceae bacterium]
MTPDLASGAMSSAEMILFWVVAPIAVISASALIFARRAVTAAVCLVATMVCLAVLYVALDAPFLAMAQVVVYTGAVMMLFVFVLMLVGVDVSDSARETIRGQRMATIVFGIGLVAVFGGAIFRAVLPAPVGIRQEQSGNNPEHVASMIFADYPFTLELVGVLLIAAALGAVVMTHRTRLTPRRTQRERSKERVRSSQVTPYPAPGVYAGRNATDVPAVDAEGRAIETSVPDAIRARGQARQLTGIAHLEIESAEPPEPDPDAPSRAPEPDPDIPDIPDPDLPDVPDVPDPQVPDPPDPPDPEDAEEGSAT